MSSDQKNAALLVIGYGNELRSDDGVGPRVAEKVAAWCLPSVRTIVCHQLTPELAPVIASAARVVFVDAARDCLAFQVRAIESDKPGEVMTHSVDPRSLLQLAGTLYGHRPPALWFTIPAENLEFGHQLSRGCADWMDVALHELRVLAAAA